MYPCAAVRSIVQLSDFTSDMSTWLRMEDLVLVATPPRARNVNDEREVILIHFAFVLF